MQPEPTRLQDLKRFYDILKDLKEKLGGTRKLADCSSKCGWPLRGVYFFFEQGEMRSQTDQRLRVVRVGKTTRPLWERLANHRGTEKGFGDHRVSAFRKIVGKALSGIPDSWGKKPVSPSERGGEEEFEEQVSAIIGKMPFLWLAVCDSKKRGYIERNSIALLSNYKKNPLDPPSADWLGLKCLNKKAVCSGLWCDHYVTRKYCPAFLDELERLVNQL